MRSNDIEQTGYFLFGDHYSELLSELKKPSFLQSYQIETDFRICSFKFLSKKHSIYRITAAAIARVCKEFTSVRPLFLKKEKKKVFKVFSEFQPIEQKVYQLSFCLGKSATESYYTNMKPFPGFHFQEQRGVFRTQYSKDYPYSS